jgi:hypothetical protein
MQRHTHEAAPRATYGLNSQVDQAITVTIACCPNCGCSFAPRAPQQVYCSPRCRVAAFRAGTRNAGVPAPKAGKEKINAVRLIPNGKTQSNQRCVTAEKQGGLVQRKAAETEFFAGRRWHKVVSPDGVVCQVSTYRPRRCGAARCMEVV